MNKKITLSLVTVIVAGIWIYTFFSLESGNAKLFVLVLSTVLLLVGIKLLFTKYIFRIEEGSNFAKILNLVFLIVLLILVSIVIRTNI